MGKESGKSMNLKALLKKAMDLEKIHLDKLSGFSEKFSSIDERRRIKALMR